MGAPGMRRNEQRWGERRVNGAGRIAMTSPGVCAWRGNGDVWRRIAYPPKAGPAPCKERALARRVARSVPRCSAGQILRLPYPRPCQARRVRACSWSVAQNFRDFSN
jgi:hypothetical protein